MKCFKYKKYIRERKEYYITCNSTKKGLNWILIRIQTHIEKFVDFYVIGRYQRYINPILIRVYSCNLGWPDLPHSNSNLSNSHSPSCSIHGILLLQTKTFALVPHLRLPRPLWSSSLPLVLHFKLQRFSQNMPIIPPKTCPYHLTSFAFAIWTIASGLFNN